MKNKKSLIEQASEHQASIDESQMKISAAVRNLPEKQKAVFNRSIANSDYGAASILHHSTSGVVSVYIRESGESPQQEIWLDIDELEDLMGLCEKIKKISL